MKKLFALLLALALALSLAACGEKEDNGASGANNQQGSQSANSGNGSTQQGGNNTNKSGVWTDGDAQTFTVDNAGGHFEVTIWDAKNTTEIVGHPGSSKHKISIITGYTGEFYVPFKIVYKNTVNIAVGSNALGMSVEGNGVILYVANEGGDYKTTSGSDTKSVYADYNGDVKSGESRVIIGYAEFDTLNTLTNFRLGGAGTVGFENGAIRPKFGERK